MKRLFSLLLPLFLLACTGNEQNKESDIETVNTPNMSHHINEITAVFNAHGGFDQWAKLKTMSYENGDSKTLVDLQNRYTLIASDEQQVGFDGEHVWVMPPSENADRQRMRYNLMFYFYAFPFVVGDPGIVYEVQAPVTLGEKTYDAVKISYQAGVGDSPKDNYIILSDQESNQMQWLMYTATFGGNEAKDQFSLIKYEGWKEMGGVLLPSSLQWYQYADGKLGEPRGGAREFSNIMVSEEFPEMSNFEAPEGAYIIEN